MFVECLFVFHCCCRSSDWSQDWHLRDQFWACVWCWNGTRPPTCNHTHSLLFIYFSFMWRCLKSAVVSLTGVHDGRVLSTDVGWPQVDVRGTHWNFTTKQPNGDKGLDTRHVLQKRQEVSRPQHDSAEQAFPHHEERHHSVHHEVEQHTHRNVFKLATCTGPRWQTSALSGGANNAGHGAGMD